MKGAKKHTGRGRWLFFFSLWILTFHFSFSSSLDIIQKKNAIYWSTVRFFFSYVSSLHPKRTRQKLHLFYNEDYISFSFKIGYFIEEKKNSYKKSTWCILKIDVCVSFFAALFFWSIHNRSNGNRILINDIGAMES